MSHLSQVFFLARLGGLARTLVWLAVPAAFGVCPACAPSGGDQVRGGIAAEQAPVRDELEELRGEWEEALDPKDAPRWARPYRFAYRLEFLNGGRLNILTPGLGVGGTVRVRPDARPKEIDFDCPDDPTVEGIYERERDTLRMCWGRPRPKGFDDPAGQDYHVLKRKR